MAKKFTVKRKTQTLELTGDYEGGEVVVVASAPMSFLFQISGMDESGMKEQEALVRRFGDDLIVSWNLVDEDGNDIPANGDGAASLPSDIFNAIVTAWTQAIAGDSNLESQPSEQKASV
jgi:hypothetical protein